MTDDAKRGDAQSAASGGVSRRTAVAMGLFGLTSGLAGCGGVKVDVSTKTEEPDIDEAREDFESAYDDALYYWKSLRGSIESAQAWDEKFRAGVVKNPEALEAFEAALVDAMAVEDVHSEFEDEPETSEELVEATEQLVAAADDYGVAARKLADAQRAVELRQPGEGSFTYTDWDGYTYRIDYNLNPAITVDTTEGKPGQVGLYYDFTDCFVTLTNTTPGKKAPGMALTLNPLYNVSDFSDLLGEIDNSQMATYGPLSQPTVFTEPPTTLQFAYENRYVNPFSSSSFNTDCWEIPYLGYSALPKNEVVGYSSDDEDEELGVGETRELVIAFMGHSNFDHNPSGFKLKVGNISDGYVDRFKNIVGWAIHPSDGPHASADEAVFVGGRYSLTLSGEGDIWFYSYDPVNA